MLDYLPSQIKESPEFSIGGLIGGVALYGSVAWSEFGTPLAFICVACVYAMLSRSTNLDHTFRSLARAVPASIVVAFVLVAIAFCLGELFSDPIQSNGRQATHLILLISLTGLMLVVPTFLTNVFMHEIAKSPKGRWLAWHIRSDEQKTRITDGVAAIFIIFLAIDVAIRTAA